MLPLFTRFLGALMSRLFNENSGAVSRRAMPRYRVCKPLYMNSMFGSNDSKPLHTISTLGLNDCELKFVKSDAELIRKPISYTELTQKRAYFRPGQDTVYLNSEPNEIVRFLSIARADELETRNIRSLAIPLPCFDTLVHRLLGYEAPFLGGLVELILITNENSEYLDFNTGLLVAGGMSFAPQSIEERMRSRQQKDPQMRFPVVKVMTDSMLKEYVEGKEASPRPAKRRAPPWANPRPAKERSLPWASNSQGARDR
ncbi:hypothetical protein ACLOAV_010755 [Pseudogymnoascus australis]